VAGPRRGPAAWAAEPDLLVRDIDFQHGKFHHAFVQLGLFPGIPIFTDVYIHRSGSASG
jgi:hypothetical protein